MHKSALQQRLGPGSRYSLESGTGSEVPEDLRKVKSHGNAHEGMLAEAINPVMNCSDG